MVSNKIIELAQRLVDKMADIHSGVPTTCYKEYAELQWYLAISKYLGEHDEIF